MKPSVFSTHASAPSNQLEAWREWFSPLFRIVPQEDDGGFIAQNQVWSLDGILVSRLSGPAVRSIRSKAEISKAPIDHWVLTYCTSGTMRVRTPAGDFTAGPRTPFLWSLGEPSDTFRSPIDRIQLLLPRDAFPDAAGLLDVARGSVLDTALGKLLVDYILLLERHLPSVGNEISPRLGSAVRDMISACIAPSADRLAIAGPSVTIGLLERIRKAVSANLRSPALTPDTLSKLVGMSRSQVYRVLESYGGAANYIKRQRLSMAFSQLADPDNRKSVGAIAEEFCFGEAATFTRAFRREFGCTPKDVRASVAQGNTVVARHARAERTAEHYRDLFI